MRKRSRQADVQSRFDQLNTLLGNAADDEWTITPLAASSNADADTLAVQPVDSGTLHEQTTTVVVETVDAAENTGGAPRDEETLSQDEPIPREQTAAGVESVVEDVQPDVVVAEVADIDDVGLFVPLLTPDLAEPLADSTDGGDVAGGGVVAVGWQQELSGCVPVKRGLRCVIVRVVLIIVVSVAAVAVVSSGMVLWRHSRVQALQEECRSLTSQVETAQKHLAELVKSEEVVKALKVTDKQVLKADKKTLSTLKDAADSANAKVAIPACEVGFFAFDANPAESVRGALKEVQGKASAISDVVANVNNAVAAKKLADAKTKLQQTVDSASKLLSDSDGKVQDNATRDQLKKAIDTATALLKASKESDPAQYATKPIDDAIAQVNASIEAKRQADEKAVKAQAEQDAQQAQSQSQQVQQRWQRWQPSYQPQPQVPVPDGGGSGVPSWSVPDVSQDVFPDHM